RRQLTASSTSRLSASCAEFPGGTLCDWPTVARCRGALSSARYVDGTSERSKRGLRAAASRSRKEAGRERQQLAVGQKGSAVPDLQKAGFLFHFSRRRRDRMPSCRVGCI